MDSARERLEKLRESNRRTTRLQSEATAQVGIFWIHPETLLLFGCYGEPTAQGSNLIDPYIDCHATHPNLWETVRGAHPDLAGRQWDAVPRGRVYFNKVDGRHHVYGPDKYILRAEVQQQVLRRFNLEADAIFEPNDDYKI